MYRYKLRAECHSDIERFRSSMGNDCHFVMLDLLDPEFVDEEFTFDSQLKAEEIKAKLLEIEDSHVMYETLEFYEQYTGERRHDFPQV